MNTNFQPAAHANGRGTVGQAARRRRKPPGARLECPVKLPPVAPPITQALFLASDEAQFITGTEIVVDVRDDREMRLEPLRCRLFRRQLSYAPEIHSAK